MKFKKNDLVFARIESPFPGYIKRASKDQKWADVCWNYGAGLFMTSRTPTRVLIHLTTVLNKALTVADHNDYAKIGLEFHRNEDKQ